jgi:hypothetical protein
MVLEGYWFLGSVPLLLGGAAPGSSQVASRRSPAFVINLTIRLIAFGSSTAIGTFEASQSRRSNVIPT